MIDEYYDMGVISSQFALHIVAAKRKGRGPTANLIAKKRKERSKGKVEFSRRLSRAVGGEELTEFITEMGVLLRQYTPLNVRKWADVPTYYKDKMWADLMV